jgi:hypothetical protein
MASGVAKEQGTGYFDGGRCAQRQYWGAAITRTSCGPKAMAAVQQIPARLPALNQTVTHPHRQAGRQRRLTPSKW